MNYVTNVAPVLALAISATLSVHAEEQTDLDKETDNIEEIVVRAHPLSAEGLAQPISIVSREELQRFASTSIGDTLNHLPGVHSSSFGQAVGRPVIRGLGGPRVKIMEDRIDSMDVSVSSPDHLTTIEPFTADSIEVLKGPSTLLYGSGAIGGVVDVHTGRIPHQVPEQIGLTLDVRGADNGDRRSAVGRLDTSIGQFALHIDGFYRDADEYEIPGFTESRGLRDLEEAEHEEEEHEGEHEDHHEEEVVGELPGSDLNTKGGAFGISRVGDFGFLGLSISAYEADYGLPGGHGHHDEEGEEALEDEEDHEAEEGNPILELEQTKFDFEAALVQPFAGIKSLNLRFGANDYEHVEVEGSGEIGTEFKTEAYEGRVELVHEEALGIQGSFGVQVSQREFAAIGEEAFVRPVDTDNYGVFYVGQRAVGELQVEGGLRFERVSHSPTQSRSRTFNLHAASIGLIRPIGERWTVSAQLDHSSRAPVAEELYSDGPHLATNSYEIGDPDLDKETALNVAATLQYQSEALTLAVSAFRTDFSDFVYESPTGAEIDELPVLLWQANDVEFRGVEADLTWRAMRWSEGSLTLKAGFDAVSAQLSGTVDDDLPRLAPRRWKLGGVVEWGNFISEFGYTRVAEQDNVALNELPTDSYENLRVYLGYRLQLGDTTAELFVRGDNLTDDEQRYHTSFIKDLAPQPGRTVEGGITIRI